LNILALTGLGLFLGMNHAKDPDHVVAVTAIAARTRRAGPAMGIGALWGLGHTLTILVVGAAIILLNLVVPPRVGLAMEFAVGIVLTVVGYLNLIGKRGFVSSGLDKRGGIPRLRAFLVGLVHGLAGSAAVALLVLSTVHEPLAAVAYLLVFGFGTILGMMLITTIFALPASVASHKFPSFAPILQTTTGLLSFAFGLWVMYDVGIVDGLFRTVPHWTPH
jgi:hypothetical protein